jgi:hypothetical protein
MEISEGNKPRIQSGTAHVMRLNDIPDPSTTKKNDNVRHGLSKQKQKPNGLEKSIVELWRKKIESEFPQ